MATGLGPTSPSLNLAFNSPLRSSMLTWRASGRRPTTSFNSPLRSSGCFGFLGFLGFAVYFEWWSLERGFGVHWMSHPCSDGVYGGVEWLFQLKENEGIEKVFQ